MICIFFRNESRKGLRLFELLRRPLNQQIIFSSMKFINRIKYWKKWNTFNFYDLQMNRYEKLNKLVNESSQRCVDRFLEEQSQVFSLFLFENWFMDDAKNTHVVSSQSKSVAKWIHWFSFIFESLLKFRYGPKKICFVFILCTESILLEICGKECWTNDKFNTHMQTVWLGYRSGLLFIPLLEFYLLTSTTFTYRNKSFGVDKHRF